MGRVAAAIELLHTKSRNMTGDELRGILIDLGFEVTKTTTPNHFVVTHDKLEGFYSTSYDASHKKQMLPNYPKNIRRVLKQHQDQLEVIVGDRDDKA